MENTSAIQLFEDQPIRAAWDEEKEEWFFSIVDVVGVLTEQPDLDGARNYWKVLKKRLNDEGSELVTNCNQLKLKSPNCHFKSMLMKRYIGYLFPSFIHLSSRNVAASSTPADPPVLPDEWKPCR